MEASVKRTTVVLAIVMVMACVGISAAQEVNAKSEVSVTLAGDFSKHTVGNGLTLTPSASAGFLTGYRYSFTPHSAVEVNYGYSRNTQYYNDGSTTTGVNTNLHQYTIDYVYKFGTSKLQPFVLAGTGALVFKPTAAGTAALTGVNSQTKAVFLYGGGFDYNVSTAVALRAQYRGLVYGSPDFTTATLAAKTTGHLAEPSVGIVFRF